MLSKAVESEGRLRADARRNRERLIEAAREAFKRDGAGASLDDIANKARLGSGTLYRHYPTREALIAGVYHQEVEDLGALSEKLMGSGPPLEALRSWMLTFADHIVEKRLIASALTEANYATARVVIHDALQRLIRQAVENGDLRPDTVAADLLRALIGVLQAPDASDARESAKRVVDLLLRGASCDEARNNARAPDE